MIQNIVKSAIMYAEHGFSVLPMIGKRPLIKFADQPPLTVEEIQSIWQANPYAGIALRTTNFFVVDIDQHNGGANGFESIKGKHLFKKTLAQQTRHGGQQLFYLKEADQQIQQNIGWLPGVDIKAHPNNYVVVAPSKGYKWLNHEPIVKPKPELIAAINQRSSQPVTTDLPVINEKTATSLLFEQIVDGLGDTGGRNNALASFIGGLLFRNVDPEKAYQLAKLANTNTPDSLELSELDRTFESMLKKELRRRGNGSQ